MYLRKKFVCVNLYLHIVIVYLSKWSILLHELAHFLMPEQYAD